MRSSLFFTCQPVRARRQLHTRGRVGRVANYIFLRWLMENCVFFSVVAPAHLTPLSSLLPPLLSPLLRPPPRSHQSFCARPLFCGTRRRGRLGGKIGHAARAPLTSSALGKIIPRGVAARRFCNTRAQRGAAVSAVLKSDALIRALSRQIDEIKARRISFFFLPSFAFGFPAELARKAFPVEIISARLIRNRRC